MNRADASPSWEQDFRGHIESFSCSTPWWSHLPGIRFVILWFKYGWQGFE